MKKHWYVRSGILYFEFKELNFYFIIISLLFFIEQSLDYRVIKESTIQATVAAKVPSGRDSSWNLPMILPGIGRNVSSDEVQWGEVILIQVINCRNLKAMDWNGLSDPYVTIVFNGQQFRSVFTFIDLNHYFKTIKRGTLNPEWNEIFGVWLPPRCETSTLSFICFDHDYILRDGFLGNLDINLAEFPRDELIFKVGKLQGVSTGEINYTVR